MCRIKEAKCQKSIFLCACPRLHPMNALYEWQKKWRRHLRKLTALYVQTPGDDDMNAEDTVRLQANMRLAQQLGAEIVTTHGEDVPSRLRNMRGSPT